MQPVLWMAVIGFSLLMYVALDGFDLGVGIMLLTERDDVRRKTMMELIATAWDGNESWLVLIGVGLFGGFPLAYSTILPALYVPIMLMLFALILRGVSVEFQSQQAGYQRGWGLAFGLGSLVAAVCQGLILGGVIQGIAVRDGVFAGGPFDFLSPWSLLTGLTLASFYALTGAVWLTYKTRGPLATISSRNGRLLALVVGGLLVVTGAVAAWTISGRIEVMLGGLALALIALGLTRRAFVRGRTRQPFALGVLALVLTLGSFGAALYPALVPPQITIWQAAAPRSSVDLLLLGVGGCIPIILTYNAYAYYVFRGTFALPAERVAAIAQPTQ